MDDITPEVQQQFSQSWTETLASFITLIDQPEYNDLIPLYAFIQQFKRTSDAKQFRSGISRQDLIISRSATAVIQPAQKFIRINVKGNLFVVSLRDSKKMYKEHTIKDLEDERLEELLLQLKDTIIS
jgi:hypothetical protein